MQKNNIMEHPINTIEQAEEAFKWCDCTTYHMWHDHTQRYDEYKSLNISRDQELQWTKQEYERLKKEVDLVSENEIWLLFYRICQKAITICNFEVLNEVYNLANQLINKVPNNNIRHILFNIIGNNATVTHGGLIQKAFEIGDIELTKMFIALSTEYIQKAQTLGIDVDIPIQYLSEVRNAYCL